MNTGIPIYLITGFLDSGKTDFLKFTMEQEYFADGERTLLILCEEGEQEYDPARLAELNTVLVTCENEADLTTDFLKSLKKQYRPERVLIEYNGMWRMDTIMNLRLPFNWEMYQIITIIDAQTFQLYLNNNNMKSMVMDVVSKAEMVIFNRCDENTPCAMFKRSLKAVNRALQVVFEDENGEMEIEEELPYDLNAPVIEIEDYDYGIWYVDAMDHPENYIDKTLKFKGMCMTNAQLPAGFFVPGRTAMTCCADDVTFLGFLCKSNGLYKVKNRQWVEVTAKFQNQYMDVYQGEGPVLYAKKIQPAEAPEEEMVYFN